jgi:hypothetical protein
MGLGRQDKAFYGILTALSPPAEREAAFLETQIPSPIHHPESPLPRLEVRICDGRSRLIVFGLH